MSFLLMILLLAMASSVSGQVTLNGKVQGELWRTENAVGQVEVFHPWGRTATMPVKEAWINIHDGRISIGAKCDDPVRDGGARKGYHMASMDGELSGDFPGYIQTITETEATCLADGVEFRTIKTAMIVMSEDGSKPLSLVFTQTDYATFDVPAFAAKMKADGGEMAKRTIEDLRGYDDLGFRQRTFRAVFN